MPWDQVCMQVTQDFIQFHPHDLWHCLLSSSTSSSFLPSVDLTVKNKGYHKCDAIVQMGGGFGLINTGEDCLHLSVHVPLQQDGDQPLAVMVWTIIIMIIKIIVIDIKNDRRNSGGTLRQN